MKELNAGLVQSNLWINNDIQNLVQTFSNKLQDPATKFKAEIYYPKLLRLQELTTELVQYIDKLKQQLYANTGATADSTGNKGEEYSVEKLLIESKQYINLYKRLKQYKAQTFNTDSMLLKDLGRYTFIISQTEDNATNEQYLKKYFDTALPLEAVAFMNHLENNIRLAERKGIILYNESTMPHIDGFRSYTAILGQNAQILKAGNFLEITGGVGAFSKQRLLEFSVNGKLVQPDNRGIASYKFKTSNNLGPHSIPVRVRLLDEDSLEQNITFYVKYTLVDTVRKH